MNRGDLASLFRLAAASVLTNGSFLLLALGELAIGFKPWQTIALNFPLATLFSYLFSRHWVFAGRQKSLGQTKRYVLVYASAYAGSMACAHMLESIGVPGFWAVFLTLFPTAAWLFIGLNFWVFKRAKPDC